MKAASFDYMRPADVAELLRVLSQRPGEAKLLAGGQSLGPMLNLRLARPRMLIDLARIDGLRGIEDMISHWRIGAAVTHSRIEDAGGTLAGAGMLAAVAGGIAHRAIRNRGTIGGSLAHADPAADWPVALAALGATVNLRSARGARNLPLDGFVLGAFTTALDDDEIIESIDVPKLSPAGRCGYYKFCRRVGDFAEASAAAVFDPQPGIARIYLGALRGTPLALATLALAVAAQGQGACSKETVAHALREAAPDLDPVERRMATGAVMRALDQVLAA
jgi:carbon-monoxide dehydrogenase medium subunit